MGRARENKSEDDLRKSEAEVEVEDLDGEVEEVDEIEDESPWPSDEPAPKQPIIALVLAFLAPPVGAILGHLALRRYLNHRVASRLAIVLGWLMTVVLVALSLSFGAWKAEQKQVDAYQHQVEQDKQAFEQAVEDSPSRGKVDREFCTELTKVAAMVPEEGFVRASSQISPSLVNGFASLGGMTTPNQEFYAKYAEHLTTFDEHDAQVHTDQAMALRKAMNDDTLGCVGLAMDEEDTAPSASPTK